MTDRPRYCRPCSDLINRRLIRYLGAETRDLNNEELGAELDVSAEIVATRLSRLRRRGA